MRSAFLASLVVASSRGFHPIQIPPSPSPSSNSWAIRRDTTMAAAAAATDTPLEQPFGSWMSPITSKSITAGSVAIGSLQVLSKPATATTNNNSSNDDLYWIEGRPQEGGRVVLCQYAPDHKDKSIRNAIDVTPMDSIARTRVHEYGGGAVTMATTTAAFKENDNDEDTTLATTHLFYSEFTNQRVYHLKIINGDANAPPHPITPDVEDCRYRFADGVYDKINNRLIMVREDHVHGKDTKSKDVVNELVSISLNDEDTEDDHNNMQVLATGNDFYAAPRLSPDGTKLSYITWNHPNMPWDATELRVIDLLSSNSTCSRTDNASALTSSHTLIAGSDGDTSILQPMWHPQRTGDLYYISDETGHYNIYRSTCGIMDKDRAGSPSIAVNVLPMEYDFGGSSPGWRLGQQGFTFLKDGRLAATYTKDGSTRLIVSDMDTTIVTNTAATITTTEYGTKDGLPMQFGDIVAGTSNANDIYFTGGSPNTPTSVYKWNLEAKGSATQLACSSTLSFPEDVISIPKRIEFPTTGKKTAFGYYYPPKNGGFCCSTTEDKHTIKPPLLVKAHGGPTSCTGTSFNAAIQFWTSRGFAVLDVDYGGSTGYGREYRRRLRGSWGIVDVDDVCAGAQYLVQKGLVDEHRLSIDGGSAGGYTTLSALAFRNKIFKAGCSLYGIGDLTALAGDTHKFESRYLDGLVGPYDIDNEEQVRVYKERSPINSVETLSCPILLLQGVEDKVVPPNQAEMMHNALLKKGIPTCLKMYEGEQHGFRKAENIEDALDSELAFYGRVYGIDIPGALEIEIDNMKKL